MGSAMFVLIGDGRTIALRPGSYVLGRGTDADIPFPNDIKLSRHHARLVVSEDAVEVEDLGSTNGTWVDAYLVQHRLRVTEPARLKIGDLELRLERVGNRGHPALTDTSREVPHPHESDGPDSKQDLPTQQAVAFAHARAALLELVELGQLDVAKQKLEPLLALVELGPTAPEPDAVHVASELALRVALASSEGSYVDTAIRIHCARTTPMKAENLELLASCAASGLEPDARNVEDYLMTLEEADKRRLVTALSRSSATMPAPAPDFRGGRD